MALIEISEQEYRLKLGKEKVLKTIIYDKFFKYVYFKES